MHWVSFSPRFSCGRFQKRVRKHSRNPRSSTRRRTERWVLRLPQEVISPGPGEEEGMGSCFSSKIFATENLERASSRVVLSTLLGRPGGLQGTVSRRSGFATGTLCVWTEAFQNVTAKGCWKEETAVTFLMLLQLRSSEEEQRKRSCLLEHKLAATN